PQIHQAVASVMSADNFYIALYDPEQDLLRFPYFEDTVDHPFLQGLQPGNGLTAYVLRTGQSLLCSEARRQELERSGEVAQLGARSAVWLGAPLVIEGNTIGVMAVQHYSDPDAY